VGDTRKATICFVAVAGIFQWSVILERSYAALWSWYEFSAPPYGGGGHITVGLRGQVAFYLCSAVLLLLAVWARPEQGGWRIASKSSTILLLVGVLAWTAMLLSPLAVLRR
jgi:hypothetical protein